MPENQQEVVARNMARATEKKKYANVSWAGLAHIVTVVSRIPLVVLWLSGKSFLFRTKSARRAIKAGLIRWMNQKFSIEQIQYLLPVSVEAYKGWARANSMPVTVEPLAHDTHLMWVGPKRTDRVVLYMHGGGYFAPISPESISFNRYIQKELLKQDCDVGFACLAYSLLPTATFPTQLRQAMLATEHILASGVHPKNLYIMGDSAGGHLILTLLSHMLHPLDTLRPMIRPNAPIGGVLLMSPWLCMKSTSDSVANDNQEDILDGPLVDRLGVLFGGDIPAQHLVYAEPLRAPEGWFKDLDKVVDHMLMTAGDKELIRDDIVEFSKTLAKHKSQYTFILQPGGLHVDPILDFMMKIPVDQLVNLTKEIIQWFAESISRSM